MASARRELERRARDAILNRIITDYKAQRDDWLKEPPIRKAIFLYSLFRTTNAFIIAGIILLTGLVALGLMTLTGLGLLGLAIGVGSGLFTLIFAEILFFYLSFRDEKLHARAVADMFEHKVEFDPEKLQNKQLQNKVDKALEYWSLIDDTIDQTSDGVLRDRMINTTREVTHWLQAVYNLAERVDKFDLNDVIRRDLANIPKTLSDYRKKLKAEDNPDVRRQLEKTIADKERQLQILRTLEDNMESATYQLDSTISSLGTIYSQLLLVGSKDESGSKINRLQDEISEQVHRLEDLTEAMDEVYQSSY